MVEISDQDSQATGSSNRSAPVPESELRGREGFLDILRAIALIRVVFWHAFGAAVITYVVSAVPAMFFVTGSLLASSLDRHGARATLVDRFRRLFVPLWAFGASAWVVMALAAHRSPGADTALPLHRALWWILPLEDPKGSVWEAGWLSAPLWYMRVLTWLLLASPLLRRLTRARPATVAAMLAAMVFALDRVALVAPAQQAGFRRGVWLLGDFALYGLFLVGGFCHRDGRFAGISPRRFLLMATGAGAAAALWLTTQPTPGRVVNDSHPAHLLVGAMWLLLAMATQRQLGWLAQRRGIARIVRFLTRRSLTIYLWHSAAIVLAYHALDRLQPNFPKSESVVAIVAIVGGLTLIAVLGVGWIEDLAGRRSPLIWPLGPLTRPISPRLGTRNIRRPSLEVTVAATFALAILAIVVAGERAQAQRVQAATVAPTETGERVGSAAVPLSRTPDRPGGIELPRTPSRAPTRPVFVPTTVPQLLGRNHPFVDRESLPDPTVRPEYPTPAAQLSKAMGDWLKTYAIQGSQAAVYSHGELIWQAALGTDPLSGKAVTMAGRFDSNSITKTFTAALIYRLADAGRLSLDDPVPALRSVPSFPAGEFTVRQLLAHSTGMVNYRETVAFTDAAGLKDPAAALAASVAAGRVFPAGEGRWYSSSNYLALGFLIEQMTGRSYDDVLRLQLLEPLGLTAITHNTPAPGWPNFAGGGLVVTVADLARWASALLRERIVMSDASFEEMTSIDAATGLGQGVWGYCPCDGNAKGSERFAGIGHSGGTTQFQYSTREDLLVVVNLTSAIPALADGSDAIGPLIEQFRQILNQPVAAEEALTIRAGVP